MNIESFVLAAGAALALFTGLIQTIMAVGTAPAGTGKKLRPFAMICLIFAVVFAIASYNAASPKDTTPPVYSSSPAPTLTNTPTNPSGTDWGLLAGDSITVNKTLTCGDGCPTPLLVRIDTIKINKGSNYMTWNIHFSAPSSSPGNGIAEVSFPAFALQSDITPYDSIVPVITSPSSLQNAQAAFPFIPPNNHIYTLTFTASYHALINGIISISPQSTNYGPVTMLFNP